MKTLITLGLALALAGASTVHAAGNALNMPEDGANVVSETHFAHRTYVTGGSHQRLNIVVRKAGDEPVLVRLMDAEGQSIYRTKVTEDGIRQPINLSYLEPGSYQVEFRRSGQVEVDTFEVK